MNEVERIGLRRFGLTSRLFLNLPMRKEILVSATWALPGSFGRIRTTFVEHLNDKMAVEAHRRVTVNQFIFVCSLSRHRNMKTSY